MSPHLGPPRRIVILGGGSAGWMSAAALATGLRGAEVTLVESEVIGTIGVGEATFPSIRNFNQLLGIDEAAFLAATGGSYKLGIQFCDWRRPGEHYFHTFGDFGPLSGPMALWGQYRRLDARCDGGLGDFCLPTVMARHGRFRLPDAGDGLGARYTYAYHFDATRYGHFLRQLAETRGARRVEGRVVDIARRPDGGVRALRLADGRDIDGDLFIDCSGFASVLMGQTLAQPFVDYSHWLPVDRAWAVPAERAPGPLLPYTRSTAMEAGWCWRIPLQDRTGHGHVFSSRHIDEDRARAQLLAQLDAPPLSEPRLLRFQTGHRERFWQHNVVAIGLAGGFVEPLESTAIFLVHNALGRLIPLLTQPDPQGGAPAHFNAQQTRQYQRIRDFIILHYCLSERRDSAFWQHMTGMPLPETLAYKLHAWRETGLLHNYDDEAFDETSWLAIHAGMQHWPQRRNPWLDDVPAPAAAHLLAERHAAIAQLAASMPPHAEFLRERIGARA
ncbi:tryptophan halogenase family protein [Roseateles puraquae]|uniref:Tryptophan halogenase n=1 Tax=Roseateles puraquae TaxID=431059 RepID=A0A254NEI0_9BURK|nr:tryptophan halogenase family protein [Roseateles puraquae]MDG0854325.1 tryptophan 7-halogenase [Roseateles puraquae]OWR03563.1 tryptophan halogenase [Roseateles puraquae]